MTLFDKAGRPKLVPSCTYPLTGVGCVSRVYTDVASFDVTSAGVVVTHTFGTTFAELQDQLEVAVVRADSPPTTAARR